MIEARNPIIGEDFSSYRFNLLHREEGNTVKGIITHGISYEFVMEALNGYRGARVLKVSTPNPMPERLLLEFAEGLDQVMAVEELDPVKTPWSLSEGFWKSIWEKPISGIWKDWKAVQRSRKQPCRFRRCRCVRRYSVPDVPTGHPSTR